MDNENKKIRVFTSGSFDLFHMGHLNILEKYWLNSEHLSVYELKNGTANNILSKETNLISNNIIDDVSDEMNDQFDKILDIE